jgi:FtsH-binding integral membrane protein
MNELDRDYPAAIAGQPAADVAPALDIGLRAFLLGVYNKVALGLLVSAGLAYLSSSVPQVRDLLFHTRMVDGSRHLIALTGAGTFVAFSPIMAMVGFGMGRTLTSTRAALLYWTLVVSVGASLGVVVLAFTGVSVATTFLASAAGFGALSLAGQVTSRDLTAARGFLVTGLVGLMAALGLNLFLHSAPLGFVVNVVGVLVFAGLVAHDSQRLKRFYGQCKDDPERLVTATHLGAINLYLDFINLFQFLLAFTGSRR